MRVEERRYYDERAKEYDDWYLGRGLYAEIDRPGWDDETRRLQAFVRGLSPGRVLDVACGTGFLTRYLRGDVTGLDQSAAMLEIAQERAPGATFVRGDALSLPFAEGAFDAVFTAHFYGHLLGADRERFLGEARRVGASLVVVDSALRPGIDPEGFQERVLSDGSRHTVYKRYFTAEGLAAEIGGHAGFAGPWYVGAAA
jgi:ubiquinone/menaquinone biosynthesis C-methylase UbiE